jgi:hypothetical protein
MTLLRTQIRVSTAGIDYVIVNGQIAPGAAQTPPAGRISA